MTVPYPIKIYNQYNFTIFNTDHQDSLTLYRFSHMNRTPASLIRIQWSSHVYTPSLLCGQETQAQTVLSTLTNSHPSNAASGQNCVSPNQ